jgi:hypothetical protein
MSIGRLLPVLTDKQTISEATRTSHQGQEPKYCTRKKKRAIASGAADFLDQTGRILPRHSPKPI